MILALDVHYRETIAKAVCIEFYNWQDSKPERINQVTLDQVAEYIPGQFYKRELPCLLKVLQKSNLDQVEMIIVDGYVFVDDDKKPGLGNYLYEALDKKIPIIGVAKTSFHNNKKLMQEIIRGNSKKPLYISAIGTDLNEAADSIKIMDGDFRIPTLLSILDRKTKEREES